MILSGWGRYPRVDARVFAPRVETEIEQVIRSQRTLIGRGAGLAYGDCAISVGATVEMRRLAGIELFDDAAGILTAQAGVTLEDIIDLVLPRGWFPAVVPGTKGVTLGGMIAADVHGKNHRTGGSFRECVEWIEVMGAEGLVRRCSRHREALLFNFTIGGMGLTGVILRATIQLRRVETGWMRRVKAPTNSLSCTLEVMESLRDPQYTVAWVDALARGKELGRGIVISGSHLSEAELSHNVYERYPPALDKCMSVPRCSPRLVPSAPLMGILNGVYARKSRLLPPDDVVDWDAFFFPLDRLPRWNRLYGRAGFIQHQCVIPLKNAEEGIRELLGEIRKSNVSVPLAVLKRMGAEAGPFSFPMEGYSIAFDFAVSGRALNLLARLDDIVIQHGGRIYLAKDSRMSAVVLRQCDSRVARFEQVRANCGWDRVFNSVLSERLKI
ncbi:putative oxidoreductase [Azorhizobium caulinodans ORS 571]|uniref:Putative oxidoreductase n=1 Tax=Azorhizobium caulinodans (strain ATCC 43989 / DSM 5975 / JCM 20966 / LMG 6465 / NBRC 14845 / NCIMB 13405 / ORS 571) TaxID=438753 RepID=A8INY9_AZOC5|nr:FAD-binding oxidoreductase [Azorhizobium caulinodans]BAF89807.1 putative oxidoreductase [Azorhizobium caulinodans ORS 571]